MGGDRSPGRLVVLFSLSFFRHILLCGGGVYICGLPRGVAERGCVAVFIVPRGSIGGALEGV